MDETQEVSVEIYCSLTAPGDTVAMVGQGPALGDWNADAAVRFDGSGFPTWTGSVRLAPNSRVEYKYVIIKGHGDAEWEAFDGNRVKQVVPGCSWKDERFGEKKSDDYVTVGFTPPPRPMARPAVPPAEAEASGGEVQLSLSCSDTSPGTCVAVAGSWDWSAKPLPLDGSQFPIWRGSIPASSSAAVEYKYVLVTKSGHIQWECRERDRSAKLGDVKDDGEVKFKKPKDEGHGRKGSEGSSVIVGAKETIYGKVVLDYGTLEQRMAKRMDQPEVLHGDHDQTLHDHSRKAPRAHLDESLDSLEHALTHRVEGLQWQQASPHLPITKFEEDSATEFAEIVAFEGRGAVTLMDRLNMARHLLGNAPDGSPVLWTVFVWLRFSQSRQLTWQRGSNTKPALLSQAAQDLSEFIAKRWVERPRERLIWRLLLSTVPRGSSSDDGQAVRDEILSIMSRHQLKKRKGDFIEQWHQKLHNNTTPDDIYICEAYIDFLRSDGDLRSFYGHLENRNISRERLQTFERPILQEPIFFPSIKNALINDFTHYLCTLKNVHAGADLEKCVDAAAQHISDPGRALLETLLAERSVQGERVVAVAGAVAAARASLPEPNSRNARDVLYLDLALENHARLLAERVGGVGLRHAALMAGLLLEVLSRSRPSPHAGASLRDFVGCLGKVPAAGYDGMYAAALAERARHSVAADSDLYISLQPRAEKLGAALRAATPEQVPEEWATKLFAEEAARGGPGFAASLMLSAYEKCLRRVSGGAAWQVVSLTDARLGTLHTMPNMRGDVKLPSPSVVLTDTLGGEEDPPEGTVAVITCSAVDVLSHIAVRARTMGVFMATCFDSEAFDALKVLEGKVVQVAAKADAVLVGETAFLGVPESLGSGGGVSSKKVCISRPPPSAELWIDESGIGAGRTTGAKSRNLAALRAHLPDWIKLPHSAVVPHGVLARVLAAPENVQMSSQLSDLSAQLKDRHEMVEVLLMQMRDTIQGLQLPQSIGPELQKAVETHGAKPGDTAWWKALTAVWASVWSDRAFHACRRAQIQTEDVAMAVLVQQLVPVEYAFVLHTRHPTGDPSDLYGELVVGLGEVLVGNHPGRALAFVAPRDGSRAPRVTSLPSKPIALSSSGLIFRSDSNAEDLEEFAGAGLFDSVPVTECRETIVEYRLERLVRDLDFQRTLLEGVGKLAMAVEAAAGGLPQDVEGCYAAGQYFVVQTRPQA